MSSSGGNLTEVFRGLYHFLYSNSRLSRSENLLGALSVVLLGKLGAERAGVDFEGALSEARDGAATEAARLAAGVGARWEGVARLDDRAVLACARELSGVRLSGAPAHALGDAFQALIGPRIRGDQGQFFTPRSLVRAMVAVMSPAEGQRVLDPACGTGGFLVEALAASPGVGALVGVEKDPELARLAGALVGVVAGERGAVACRDTLRLGPEGLLELAGGPVDVVLANPPFGARVGVRDPEVLATYDLGRRWEESGGEWSKTGEVLGSQDPQVLFLELCVRALKPGGKLGIVLPEGLFGNRRAGFVWAWLATQGRISAMLDCPRTTFQPGTDTKTNAIFFERGCAQGPVWVAVAEHCGHDRRGRAVDARGEALPDDFPALGESFGAREATGTPWGRVERLRKDYRVPRYYVDPPVADPRFEGVEEVTLGSLVRAGALLVGKGHEVGSEAYGSGPVPFVRTSDIANLEVRRDPTRSVSQALFERYGPMQGLSAGDVLLVADGRYRIGASAMITAHSGPMVVQSHIRVLRSLDRARVDPHGLLLALNLPHVRRRLRHLVFVQTTLGTVGRRLLELRLPVLWDSPAWADEVARFGALVEHRARLLAEIDGLASLEPVEV